MIYIVDSGIDHTKLHRHTNYIDCFSSTGEFFDNIGHGTSLANAITTVHPTAELGIVKNCNTVGNLTTDSLTKSLLWLYQNVSESDVVLWCYIMPYDEVDTTIKSLFDLCLSKSQWIIPSGNSYLNTEDYYPCGIGLSLPNVHVVGALNKSQQIASCSNTPADVYVTGTNQPVAEKMLATGTSISAAYYAGMISNPQETYTNAINEDIRCTKALV